MYLKFIVNVLDKDSSKRDVEGLDDLQTSSLQIMHDDLVAFLYAKYSFQSASKQVLTTVMITDYKSGEIYSKKVS